MRTTGLEAIVHKAFDCGGFVDLVQGAILQGFLPTHGGQPDFSPAQQVKLLTRRPEESALSKPCGLAYSWRVEMVRVKKLLKKQSKVSKAANDCVFVENNLPPVLTPLLRWLCIPLPILAPTSWLSCPSDNVSLFLRLWGVEAGFLSQPWLPDKMPQELQGKPIRLQSNGNGHWPLQRPSCAAIFKPHCFLCLPAGNTLVRQNLGQS